jgi:acyl dehydratase
MWEAGSSRRAIFRVNFDDKLPFWELFMPIRADIIGFEQQVTRQVSWRWALAYAASLGFGELDDGLVPGPFCVCLEWEPVGSDARAERCGLNASERLRNVHVSQDSTFHRPIRPGMRVTTTSRIVYGRQTSAGAFLLTRLENREAESGDLLVTSWSGAMLRGVPFDGPLDARMPADAPSLPEGVTPSPDAVTIPTARSLPHIYSECARIWNPIHTERAVALAAGLPDIILHGTITWALAGAAAVGGVGRLRRLSAQFRAPVIPGEAFTLHRQAAPGGVQFAALTEGGATALARGWAELI